MNKFRLDATPALLAAVTGACLAVPALWVAKEEAGAPADDEIVAWVSQQVKERQPTNEEKRFDEIGWAKDLRDAIRLGKEHDRPVFLFTMDGRINTGRC